MLDSPAAYRAWGRTMQADFEAHRAAVDAGDATVMAAYGATNPAEFFAVATEHFFERPAELREYYPGVYEVLKGFYRQDPAAGAA